MQVILKNAGKLAGGGLMDLNSCRSPSPPSAAMATSLNSMSVDELSNWLKTDGGIPDKFCESFTGKLDDSSYLLPLAS